MCLCIRERGNEIQNKLFSKPAVSTWIKHILLKTMFVNKLPANCNSQAKDAGQWCERCELKYNYYYYCYYFYSNIFTILFHRIQVPFERLFTC